ncbi:MAG: hypothetical protein C0493_13120 [Kytococcus sp.]|nr:hypothetical protein [Kytococcus sp.]
MGDETMRLGHGELAGLAQRVLGEWQAGPGAEAEQVETCPDCGEWLGYEDPQEQEMAEQWRAGAAEWSRVQALRVGGWGNGWPSTTSSSETASTGWPWERDADVDFDLDV